MPTIFRSRRHSGRDPFSSKPIWAKLQRRGDFGFKADSAPPLQPACKHIWWKISAKRKNSCETYPAQGAPLAQDDSNVLRPTANDKQLNRFIMPSLHASDTLPLLTSKRTGAQCLVCVLVFAYIRYALSACVWIPAYERNKSFQSFYIHWRCHCLPFYVRCGHPVLQFPLKLSLPQVIHVYLAIS